MFAGSEPPKYLVITKYILTKCCLLYVFALSSFICKRDGHKLSEYMIIFPSGTAFDSEQLEFHLSLRLNQRSTVKIHLCLSNDSEAMVLGFLFL